MSAPATEIAPVSRLTVFENACQLDEDGEAGGVGGAPLREQAGHRQIIPGDRDGAGVRASRLTVPDYRQRWDLGIGVQDHGFGQDAELNCITIIDIRRNDGKAHPVSAYPLATMSQALPPVRPSFA